MDLIKKILPFCFLICFIACQSDDDLTLDQNFDDFNDTTPNDDNNGDVPANINLATLGKFLFWDPVLSGEKDVACATCHHPEFGYAEGRALSIGVGGIGLGPDRFDAINDDIGLAKRNAPTIINTRFNGMDNNGNFNPQNAPMFWDNRANSLEEQAIGPLLSFEEMRGHAYTEDLALDSIIVRLENIPGYQNMFTEVFGSDDAITSENIAEAIAAFERSVVAINSPFDRFENGDQNAMTQAQIRGMNRFNQIGCDDCHSGPMFSDFELHVVGVPDHPALGFSDDGANGTYAFRTPTLRNLSETGPYFHNGVAMDLEQTIRFYITARNEANGNNGGGPGGLQVNPNVNGNQIDDEVQDLRPFDNDDIDDIVAFIQALNDPDFDRSIPAQVPSGLNPGGNIE